MSLLRESMWLFTNISGIRGLRHFVGQRLKKILKITKQSQSEGHHWERADRLPHTVHTGRPTTLYTTNNTGRPTALYTTNNTGRPTILYYNYKQQHARHSKGDTHTHTHTHDLTCAMRRTAILFCYRFAARIG